MKLAKSSRISVGAPFFSKACRHDLCWSLLKALLRSMLVTTQALRLSSSAVVNSSSVSIRKCVVPHFLSPLYWLFLGFTYSLDHSSTNDLYNLDKKFVQLILRHSLADWGARVFGIMVTYSIIPGTGAMFCPRYAVKNVTYWYRKVAGGSFIK